MVRRTQVNAAPPDVGCSRVIHLKVVDLPLLLVGQNHGIVVAVTVDERQVLVCSIETDDWASVDTRPAWIQCDSPTSAVLNKISSLGEKVWPFTLARACQAESLAVPLFASLPAAEST